MNKKLYTTIATPQYFVKSVKGDFFNIFNKRENAIKEAIKMAFDYHQTTFIVTKKVLTKEKKIFSFKFDSEFEFDDFQTIHNAILNNSRMKLDKTKFWRKNELNED